MTQIIKILKSSIKKNPDYGYFGQKFIEGPQSVSIDYIGNPSKKQLKKCIEYEALFPLNAPPERRLMFNGTGREAIQLFGDDANATITVINKRIETTCKDYGPEYLYKYQNPSVKCSECGISSRLSDIQRDDDNGYSFDICPRCASIAYEERKKRIKKAWKERKKANKAKQKDIWLKFDEREGVSLKL